MTRTTETTARGETTHHQALGRYGETLAERHLTGLGMVLLDRNWRCPDGEADLVLRDGSTLVVCEVKTRSNLDHGSPHEAVTPEKVERMGRVAHAWLTSARRRPTRGSVRPRRRAASTTRRLGHRARAGARLMPVASTRTISLQGTVGHLIDVQADVSPGTVGTTMVGRPDVTFNEAKDRCRMAVLNSERTGRRRGGSRSCSRRPT